MLTGQQRPLLTKNSVSADELTNLVRSILLSINLH
jgi:hypothetical protein